MLRLAPYGSRTSFGSWSCLRSRSCAATIDYSGSSPAHPNGRGHSPVANRGTVPRCRAAQRRGNFGWYAPGAEQTLFNGA
jgi:hypothetical protein